MNPDLKRDLASLRLEKKRSLADVVIGLFALFLVLCIGVLMACAVVQCVASTYHTVVR